MKKQSIIILLCLCVLVLGSSLLVSANDDIVGCDVEKIVGFDFPVFGWAQHNEEGKLTGYKGINIEGLLASNRGVNLGLGYSQKDYIKSGLEINDFNPYFGFGTWSIIIPYVEVGVDYVFEVNEDGSFLTVGGSVSLTFPLPSAKMSLAYHF